MFDQQHRPTELCTLKGQLSIFPTSAYCINRFLCSWGQAVTCTFTTPWNNNVTLRLCCSGFQGRCALGTTFQTCRLSAWLVQLLQIIRRSQRLIIVDFVVDGDDDIFSDLLKKVVLIVPFTTSKTFHKSVLGVVDWWIWWVLREGRPELFSFIRFTEELESKQQALIIKWRIVVPQWGSLQKGNFPPHKIQPWVFFLSCVCNFLSQNTKKTVPVPVWSNP